jgi:hypothetical protein
MRVNRLVERHIAVAAVAAAAATLTDVIITGVLGAKRADAPGLLLTDAARERH